MPRFFTDPISNGEAVLTGEDAVHVSRSLRMTIGETLTLCDGTGNDYLCTITAINSQEVTLRVDSTEPSRGEPDVEVLLFQGLPKSDKMDWIVQKSVELGVSSVIPFAASRSISRPDEKSAGKKADRWQKIASEAAMQSQRGKLPQVHAVSSFSAALNLAKTCDRILVCYEGGGETLRSILSAQKPERIAVFIGPEGGFERSEVEAIEAIGGKRVTLGSRILRTETAPLAALSAIMFATGNMD